MCLVVIDEYSGTFRLGRFCVINSYCVAARVAPSHSKCQRRRVVDPKMQPPLQKLEASPKVL